MAHDTDQRIVSELMDLVQQRDGQGLADELKRGAPSHARRIFDIVLWSSITNVVLLGCFMLGWNFEAVRTHVFPKPSVASAAPKDTPLSVSGYRLEDNELLTRGPQRQLKGPLQITMVPTTAPEVEANSPAPETVASAEPAASETPEASEQDQGDGSGDMIVGPEDPAAQQARSPVLRIGRSSGTLEIGTFATMSLPGGHSDCLDTAYGLLDDVGAPRDKLKVLAESKAITVARICASNGSLVVTCRMDQITISPRRLKPNETCTG